MTILFIAVFALMFFGNFTWLASILVIVSVFAFSLTDEDDILP